MSQTCRIGVGIAAACVAALVAGCESNRDMSPAAPSAIAGGGLQSESAGSSVSSSSSGVIMSAARPTTKPEPPKPDPSREGDHPNAEVELRGVISQLNGVCPAVTFKLDRVEVKTTDGTEFEGAHCVDLKEGMAVKVKGVREGEGVVKASKVEAQRTGPTPTPSRVELRGTVADLKGTCPEVSFHLGRPLVSTNNRTEFEGLRCQDLKNGAFVKVTGERSGEGSVLAKSVEGENHDSRTFEVKGKISAVTGTCPSVTFTVGRTTLSANDRTHYRGLTCADLATWKDEVVVKGKRQDDGSLIATHVAAEKDKH